MPTVRGEHKGGLYDNYYGSQQMAIIEVLYFLVIKCTFPIIIYVRSPFIMKIITSMRFSIIANFGMCYKRRWPFCMTSQAAFHFQSKGISRNSETKPYYHFAFH